MGVQVGQFIFGRRYGFGDFEQDCKPGEYLVDAGGDYPICLNSSDAIESGFPIVGQVGKTPPISTTPAPPRFGNTAGAPTVPAAPRAPLVQQLEGALGISGTGLAIGMGIVLFVMMRKK